VSGECERGETEDLPDAQGEGKEEEEMPGKRAEKDCPESIVCPQRGDGVWEVIAKEPERGRERGAATERAVR
jgi:hypothetical protein